MTAADCPDDVCVTCSDYAAPAEVLRLDDAEMALVRLAGTVQQVSVALVDARVGDTVLVHAGEAIGMVGGHDV
ncbi:hydrogenase assembly protein HupF [Rhizocola hellebori]|uniref:Hydrogenase assembly protein HupF n=1 Tax=Rhizocola hellebori TaxID=1392758 RepID=A0A8J3Q7V4_9ACTN|nr:HypC/HybG/HupF family hydrogenase formation chaperone [Rhizocola hellebori]GIH04868.1 hydrogenase assembly protein HupF [Rhizocola hellebori]